MKDLLIKMASIANELDSIGLEKEANQNTVDMLKLAQVSQAAKQGQQAARQISTMLEQRKAIPGQYKLDAAEFQKTLDFAVANKLTLRGMYDQAVRNRGGGDDARNYANNLIAKYRNIHGNVPDTALVVTTKLT